MTATSLQTSDLDRQPVLAHLLSEVTWPLALLAPDQRILRVSRPLAALTGVEPQGWQGQPATALFEPHERAELDTLLEGAARGVSALRRATLRCSGEATRRVEVEALPVGDAGMVTLLVHSESLSRQRDRMLLELNRLTPTLLAAPTVAELFVCAGQALQALGLNLSFHLLEPDGTALRVVYTTLVPELVERLSPGAPPVAQVRLPPDMPGYTAVLGDHQTRFMPPDWSFLTHLIGPEGQPLAAALLRLSGVRGYILAPLGSDHERGVLVVWGPVLNPTDLPFVAAFANQLTACMAQIALRNQMARQIQRLNSLATTAHAVTTLGGLDEVLQVICRQAQELLGGEMAAVALPKDADVSYVMSTGRDADRLSGLHLPIDSSVIGRVLRSGQGRYVADMRHEPEAYQPTLALEVLRCMLCQPLIHRGAVLGVLVVCHSTPAHFGHTDLSYLARYAEYAAVAVANAQLHNELQYSEKKVRALFLESEESRTYLNTLIAHTHDVLGTVRPDLTFHPLNPHRASILSGYHITELDGQSLLNLVPEHQHQALLEHWRAIQAGRAYSFEMPLRRADGAIMHTLVSAMRVPLYNEVFVIIKDITAYKQLEAEVRRTEKLALIGQLVAGVAHELNNPLAVILGLAQLQLFEQLPDPARADMVTIEQSALRARQIVEQLRVFTRPQPEQPQPIDLHEAVHVALARLKREIARLRAEVFLDLENSPRAPLGTPDQIEQALLHLLTGALQSLDRCPPGQPRHLRIRTWTERDAVRLAISDSGPGLPHQQRPQPIDPRTLAHSIGEGIDLSQAIVMTIVQQHGGRCWVESEPGRRTTVHLMLPLKPAEQAAPARYPPPGEPQIARLGG
ncbi:MAG TPA: GAF domain-containing protein [Roseiflexaceae bacterium]|nr:GAF domain-containing protein [Roseiflexaceae bacterium]